MFVAVIAKIRRCPALIPPPRFHSIAAGLFDAH
jgi:hypothetical protein